MLRRHVEIGDKVTEKVTIDGHPPWIRKTGEVIWIHPKGRFYRVRFEGKRAPVVEAYHLARSYADEGDRI